MSVKIITGTQKNRMIFGHVVENIRSIIAFLLAYFPLCCFAFFIKQIHSFIHTYQIFYITSNTVNLTI